MLRYNNIVNKAEPLNKTPIDHALDECKEVPTSTQTLAADGVDCIVVDNFLTADECDHLIAACESVGYTFWSQNEHEAKDGEEKSDASTKAVRVVDTIEGRFPRLSAKLYERIAAVVELVPKVFSRDMKDGDELYERDLEGRWEPHALSENLLLGRYHPGGHFMPHIDGSTVVDLNTRSFYTLLIYLNDCPAGGETVLFAGEQCNVMFLDESSQKYRGKEETRVAAVHPRKGSAAFFYYDLLHEAAPVTDGLKYICRADLLYRRNPPILTADSDVAAFRLYEEARLAESSGEALRACELFQRVRKLSKGVAELYQLD